MASFTYFEAPETEMLGLLRGARRCGICAAEAICFDLSSALRTSEVAASTGCVACLKAGRFGFSHITEIGYLDASGLTWYDDDEPKTPARVFAVDTTGAATAMPVQVEEAPRATVPRDAIDELRRTPDFPTWNEVAWPVHCSDFMVYLGTWQPGDVRTAAIALETEPRALFVEMTDVADERVWSDDLQNWSFAFHVFRCRSCRRLRGAIDLD